VLIKRLLHRWVLMNEAGGADAGGSGAGAADAAGAASGAGASADAGAAAGANAAAGAGDHAGAAAGEAGKTGSVQSGIDPASLQPPASLVGEAGKEGQAAEGEGAKEGEAQTGKEGEKVDDKPVEYTDFTLPEGFTIEDDALKAFKEAAAGAKLTQEQAQAFVDQHAAALQKAASAPYEAWRDTQEAWQKEIKADPEFGGAKLEKETIPSIARAIKAFSPNAEAEAALRQAFHFTGAGNHPEMIRFMARIGKSLAEGSHVAGGPTSGDGGKSAAQKLYPTQGGSAQS
jgi:hypothetical protein